jgi:methylase of polypeptide subunit release factors
MTTLESARGDVRTTPFGPLTIAYDDTVLEPRAWTAMQSRWAQEAAADAPAGRVLELCAGAGQIGLLAVHGTDRELVAVDASAEACAFARANAEAAGLAERVEVRHARLDVACAEDETFAVVIADPPWVPRAEITRFPEDPVQAIDGGPDGLDLAQQCLEVIARHLLPGGVAFLQVGDDEQVRRLEDALPDRLAADGTRSEPGRGVVMKIVARQ